MPAAASLRFDSAQNRERGARRFSSSQGDAADGGLHAEALGRLPRRRRRHVEPGGVTRPDAVVQPVRHRRGRRGFGRSYVDAFRRVLASDADLVCQMDADLSHGPSYLPALVAAAGTFDVVIGSRHLHGVSVVNRPLHRIALSAAANRYVRAITGAPVADCTSGFRCRRREALGRIPLDRLASNGYAFLIETLHEALRRGARIGEVPIRYQPCATPRRRRRRAPAGSHRAPAGFLIGLATVNRSARNAAACAGVCSLTGGAGLRQRQGRFATCRQLRHRPARHLPSKTKARNNSRSTRRCRRRGRLRARVSATVGPPRAMVKERSR